MYFLKNAAREEILMEQIISRDGTPIGFRRSGTGPPLLLVHGATADHRRWATISPRFESDFTVYAMDRRGRGMSGDTRDYDLLREAEDVAAVVEALNEPAFVLGHSFGGLVCLEAALLTDRISRMILYEPDIPTEGPAEPPEVVDQILTLVEQGESEAAIEALFREIVKMPEHELEAYRQLPMWKVRVQLAGTIARELEIFQTYRLKPERFAGLQTPTLLLVGGDSPSFSRQANEALDAALPNSKIVVLAGQGHIAMDMAPELFAREVRRFLLE
jgi:pimeloyl-ACP methyl ester carboxylesterase